MKKIGNILWGIVLIAIGVILAGNALGITNINIFFDGWWTLLIIVPCFIGLFKEREKVGNLIGLLVGVALLLCCRDLISFGMVVKLAFPAILVLVGVSLIFKDVFNKKISDEIKRLNKNNANENEFCATFAGQDANFEGEEFKGANLTAMFGGIKCDLRKAIINEDQVINAKSVFGGIDLLVPNNVKVKIKSSSLFGGVSDKRKNIETTENSKTIYINATCIFGGVDIK